MLPPRARRGLLDAIVLLAALTAAACDDDDPPDEPDAGTPSAALAARLDTLIEESGVASIAAGVVIDGALHAAAARGYADLETERPATLDTIYGIASCSKPVVGLAAALLADAQPEVDLDADIDDWLDGDPDIAHPAHPDTPITLRMLLTHTSGIAADGPDDYETYPKPDPDTPLDEFLGDLLADPAHWVGPPGEGEAYSNLGIALAALVIERAAGVDFRAYTEEHIFDPLGMDDTRWFYGDLSAAQQARHAIPHDADGEPYAIYGFNDYPSGQLRSTVPDLARLMTALSAGGRFEGRQVLPAAAVERFHRDRLAVEADDEDGVAVYDHSGGESGVTAYFTWRGDGIGFVYLANTDLDDDEADALEDALTETLEDFAGLR